MKKTKKISTRIKNLTSLVIVLVFIIISSTIFLNERNSKDALVINIVGKQRMLTQQIAKNVFYLYQTNTTDFTELDAAIQEFIYALNSLKEGNDLLKISPVSDKLITSQFYVIDVIWNNYIQNVEQFKREIIFGVENNNHSKPVKFYVNAVNDINKDLLFEVDKLVNFYTLYAENKTAYLRYFQFAAGFVLLVVFLYIYNELKEIENNIQNFIVSLKQVALTKDIKRIELLQPPQEDTEIIEISDSFNAFIEKVNSAMEFSTNAIIQSKYATSKLEEITDEFEKVIDNMQDSAHISEHLNTSEDMVIESTEDLINSTKRLEELKNKLNQLKELSTNKLNEVI